MELSVISSDPVQMTHPDHICSPLKADDQRRIATTFYGLTTSEVYYSPIETLQPYLTYYQEQCKIFHLSLRSSLSFMSHEAIEVVAGEIRRGQAREQLIQDLLDKYPDIQPHVALEKIDVIHGIANLAARLLLMADVGKLPDQRIWTGRSWKLWGQGSIQSFTAAAFPVCSTITNYGIQLDTDFNARNLEAIAGLHVELTNNLLDHLQVIEIEGKTTIMIFHHVSFLQNQGHSLFPDGFVEETLQTSPFSSRKTTGTTRAKHGITSI